ncbi:MAG TPA: PorV/PorQ family protein [Crocinitomix sp.]|nr:PorV/PorQ family protein [Crocinitomix sp.]
MKNILGKSLITALAISMGTHVYAGNKDRIGSAGATELLINPWSRAAAFGSAGIANTNGLAATYTNIAGLAFTTKTEIILDRTQWLRGAGININAAGIAQRINPSTVLSFSMVSMSFGEIDITTVNQPEGGIGTFEPKLNNFNLGFAHEFSNSIYGGLNVKVLSQTIANLRGRGVAFDAGIRYVTGEEDHIKFGITLKNVGPTMSVSGDGLALFVLNPETGQLATLEQRSASFELPSLLSIGGSYDFNFSETSKLTAAVGFTANSFSSDQYRLGLDYAMDIEKASFHILAGFVYQEGLFKKEFGYDQKLSALTGLTAGVSVDAILGENKNNLGIQYTYRTANPFGGVHSIGLTLNLK